MWSTHQQETEHLTAVDHRGQKMHNVALNKTQSSAWTHKVAQTQQGSRRSLFVFPPCSLFGFTAAEKLQRLRDVVTPVSQWYGKVDKAITLSLQNIDFDASQPRKLAEGRFYYRPRWAERRQIELSPDRSHHSLSRLSRRHMTTPSTPSKIGFGSEFQSVLKTYLI